MMNFIDFSDYRYFMVDMSVRQKDLIYLASMIGSLKAFMAITFIFVNSYLYRKVWAAEAYAIAQELE